MTNLQNIEKIAKTYKNVEEVKKDLKSVQSTKCRLKKQKGKETYEKEMTEIIKKEQILKEVRDYFEPKKLTVTTMTENDIKNLDYDDTIRAIKSIQSKKCNSQYNEATLENNVEYQQAIQIESWLQAHKLTIKEVPTTAVKKSDLNSLISNLENTDELSKEYLLEQLKNLMK